MSSSYRKRSKHSSRSSHSDFPTQWSDWTYVKERDCYQRYRLKAKNQYEYEYQAPQYFSTEQQKPRDQDTVGSIPTPDGSYTESSLYTTSNVQTDALSRSLGGLSLEPSKGLSSANRPSAFWQTPNVTTSDPTTKEEAFDPHYKVQKPKLFLTGKIFKVLWSEPKGTGYGSSNNTGTIDSVTEREGKYGELLHQKVRRFVIINPMAGHCICLPIMTYGGQGVTKRGVHAEHHTIIYSGAGPIYLPGEEQKLTKMPLLVTPTSPRHKLDPASRLNYAKTYTVEYNVKVWFIGQLVDASYWQMAADYNSTHPPLPTTPSQRTMQSHTPQDTYSHAMGGGGSGTSQSLYDNPSTVYSPTYYSNQSSYPQVNPTLGRGLSNSEWSDSMKSPHTTSAPLPIASSNPHNSGLYLGEDDVLLPLPGERSSSAYQPSYMSTRQHVDGENVDDENFDLTTEPIPERPDLYDRGPSQDIHTQHYDEDAVGGSADLEGDYAHHEGVGGSDYPADHHREYDDATEEQLHHSTHDQSRTYRDYLEEDEDDEDDEEEAN